MMILTKLLHDMEVLSECFVTSKHLDGGIVHAWRDIYYGGKLSMCLLDGSAIHSAIDILEVCFYIPFLKDPS